MSHYEAVFVDLDGTWISRDKQVGDRDRAAVAAARQAGLCVYLNTGRSVSGTVPLHALLGTNSPVFCANGAVVHDPDTGVHLSHTCVDEQAAAAVFGLADEHDVPVLAFHGDDIVGHLHHDLPGQASATKMRQSRIRTEASRSELPRTGLTKIWVIVEPELVPVFIDHTAGPACRWVQPRVDPSFLGAPAGRVLLSATGVLAMKRAALEWIRDHEGVPLEAMIAVGDHDNDLEAVQAAGLGVAVRTASAEILDAADRIIDAPEDDGVAALLEELAR